MTLFHIQTKVKIPQKTHYKKWIKHIAQREGRRVGELNVILCSDEYLLDMNQKYLNHNTYTDIITFDYSEDNRLSGDIFISTDRVQENASMYNVDFQDELKRVIAHGVLHLCGYKDKTKMEKEKMREMENIVLNEFSKMV